MPTGACGINCDVCKLRLLGICSTCGSGRSDEARRKLEAQERLFGATCAILACARMNRIEYCLRDCNAFPCENFHAGPYPFSPDFLAMQERRRRDRPPPLDHNGRMIQVPPENWETLRQRDRNTLLNLTLFTPHASGGLLFRFLNEDILVDPEDRCLKRLTGDRWTKTEDPLLELITLLYLNRVKVFHPLGKDIVGPRDLKAAHYFQGRHALPMGALMERYGRDPDGFKVSAEHLDGKPLDMADRAFRLLPFPRVPLYYLWWEGDREFAPLITVLFDRSIEECLPPSAVWGLVTLVNFALLQGPGKWP